MAGQMEAGSLPIVQEPLVPTKGAAIAPEVSAALEEICRQGLLAEGDLDSKTMDTIAELPTEDALAVFQEFRDHPNLDAAASKGALLCSLAAKSRQRTRMASRHMGPAGDAAKPGPDEAKLKEILERTKYSHEITTGQRKYGGPPPDWEGPQPGPGHEIYCGKLPKELFEDTLVPLFEKHGQLWDMRLMIDPMSGRNRGYCFVTYADKTAALDAIAALNDYEVLPGRKLKVNPSIANVRLFVGNIPKNRSREEILEELGKHTEGLVDVIVYNSPDDERKKNRGFAFVDYETHKAASNARRTLGTGRVRIWGAEMFVDWAEPQEEPDDDTMSKVKVLYVRNLKSDITEEQLKEVFEPYGEVERAKRVKGYGFVHFVERESALKAMEALNGTKLGELEVEISLAKPSSRKNKDRRRFQQQFRTFPNGGYGDQWNNAYGGGYGVRPEYDYYGYDGYVEADYYGGYDSYGYYSGGRYGNTYGGNRRGDLWGWGAPGYGSNNWGAGGGKGYRGNNRRGGGGGANSQRR